MTELVATDDFAQFTAAVAEATKRGDEVRVVPPAANGARYVAVVVPRAEPVA